MSALYAYLRLTDDITDSTAPVSAKFTQLDTWRSMTDLALAGTYHHPCFAALTSVVKHYSISPTWLFEVIKGCEADLRGQLIENDAALLHYCYQVASVVGLACLPIWGFRNDIAREQYQELAVHTGYAFQLTNILRDLKEDAARGRCYLPQQQLLAYGCDVQKPLSSEPAALRRLLQTYVERTKMYFRACPALQELLQPDGQCIFGAMYQTYYALLLRVETEVLAGNWQRQRLPRFQKLGILAHAWQKKLFHS